MTDKVTEYTNAGYIYENPANADEVIWTVEMRISKADVNGDGDMGCFEIGAGTGGWNPDSGVDAPVFCANGVKAYSAGVMAEGMRQLIEKKAAAQYEAWLASQQ